MKLIDDILQEEIISSESDSLLNQLVRTDEYSLYVWGYKRYYERLDLLSHGKERLRIGIFPAVGGYTYTVSDMSSPAVGGYTYTVSDMSSTTSFYSQPSLISYVLGVISKWPISGQRIPYRIKEDDMSGSGREIPNHWLPFDDSDSSWKTRAKSVSQLVRMLPHYNLVFRRLEIERRQLRIVFTPYVDDYLRSTGEYVTPQIKVWRHYGYEARYFDSPPVVKPVMFREEEKDKLIKYIADCMKVWPMSGRRIP